MLRNRPSLPEDRLQSISSLARARARASMFSARTQPQKESLLRSRIAITLMLVFGFAFSGAGVGMAVTGLADENQSAAGAQYPASPPPAAPQPEGETLEPGEVIGAIDEGEAPEADEPAPVQETRQLGAEEGGEELPFTGFAAIPVLLLGFALLTTGFILRRGDAR